MIYLLHLLAVVTLKNMLQTNFENLGTFFPDGYSDHGFSITRQVGESVSATGQEHSRRLICRRGRRGTERRCRLSIERLMQINEEKLKPPFKSTNTKQSL